MDSRSNREELKRPDLKEGSLSFAMVLFLVQQHLCLNSPSLNERCSSALIGLIIFHVPLALLVWVSAAPGLDVGLLWGSFPAAERPLYNV